MRTAYLHDILRDGTICDNQHYCVENVCLHNRRMGEVHLKGEARKKYKPERCFRFLVQTEAALQSDKLRRELVVFGEDYEHNTDDPFISVSGRGPHDFSLQTGNLVGHLQGKVDGFPFSLKISSRFGDDFLRYIIADADGFLEIDRMGGDSRENDFSWLLAYLWNIKFRRACRLGLPKSYEERRERLPRPRGNLDPVDFQINGRSGHYACAYREHSFRNPTVSLIVAAYEKLAKGRNQAFLRAARPQYRAFAEAAAGERRDRQQLLAVRPLRNPFFVDYNPVIELSKSILRQKALGFGTESPTSGFLFDVSMLFEYFIRKTLRRAGLPLLPKSKGQHRIPRGNPKGSTHDLQPDLLLEHAGKRYLFDVKYKAFNMNEGVSRDDLFQLHTYAARFSTAERPMKAFGLIYPLGEARWDQLGAAADAGMIRRSARQHGRDLDFVTLFLRIPSGSGEGFVKAMQNSVEGFVQAVLMVLNESH